MNGRWLIPFAGQNKSGCAIQNFLWKDGRTFVMDNHRAALWCWLQCVNPDERHNLIHIDAHYDAGNSCDPSLLIDVDFRNIPVNDYLQLCYPNSEKPLVRWDNYIPTAMQCYPRLIANGYFATHTLKGGPPATFPVENIGPFQLGNYLDTLAESGADSAPLILNVDLDYFFVNDGRCHYRWCTDEHLSRLVRLIAGINSNCNTKVLTIALSPECCGGWDNATNLCEEFCNLLGVDFDSSKLGATEACT